MLEIELIKLIEDIQLKKTESNYIEVKSAWNGCPKIFDTLSSFSNQQNGGTIIFGVDENEDYNVCGGLTTPENETARKLADVNGDGTVSIADATLIQKSLVGRFSDTGNAGKYLAEI